MVFIIAQCVRNTGGRCAAFFIARIMEHDEAVAEYIESGGTITICPSPLVSSPTFQTIPNGVQMFDEFGEMFGCFWVQGAYTG